MALPHPRRASSRRIVRDPHILGGEPTLEGTRIPVRIVVLASRSAANVDEIVDAYPVLDEHSVEAALAYYQTHQDEIDFHIAENDDSSV